MKIVIRKAKLEELPRVIYITKLAYKIPYKEKTLITKSHEPVNLKDIFKEQKFFVLVAVCNGKIVGAVRYKFIEDNNVYLYKLVTLKTYRNIGVGSSLIQVVEKQAQKNKSKKILLDCAQEKKLADYYKKQGFKIDKVKKHLDHHDVYMSKNIKRR